MSLRVLRGGSWSGIPDLLRSAYRGRNQPDYSGNGIGFRVARAL
jgi:formylglycine-generating enzyme required for sulfatase activity